jgi:hypothetical protein
LQSSHFHLLVVHSFIHSLIHFFMVCGVPFSLCGAGDLTQRLAHARQALSLSFLDYFSVGERSLCILRLLPLEFPILSLFREAISDPTCLPPLPSLPHLSLTGPRYVTQAGLKFMTLQPPPPKLWDCRCTAPRLGHNILFL